MSSASYYYDQAVQYLVDKDASVSDLMDKLGGTKNPNGSIPYTPDYQPAYRAQAMSNEQIKQALDIPKNYYDSSLIQAGLDSSTTTGYTTQQLGLKSAQQGIHQSQASSLKTSLGLVKPEYQQGTQSAQQRSVYEAQALSASLANQNASKLAENNIVNQQMEAYNKYVANLASNKVTAQNLANKAEATISDIGESLYKSDILYEEAVNEYNKRVAQTEANVLMNQNNIDLAYEGFVRNAATSMYGVTQQVKKGLLDAAQTQEEYDKKRAESLASVYAAAASMIAQASSGSYGGQTWYDWNATKTSSKQLSIDEYVNQQRTALQQALDAVKH